MDSDKIVTLVKNIKNLKYPKSILDNVEGFEHQLAKDLSTDGDEAFALLGYLVTNDYVRIDDDMGIIVNPSNEEIRMLVDTGRL